MTRSSTNELFTHYKETEREFRSSRRHFKTLSLDELRSPDFNLLSDQEYSEEEVADTIAETMEQYMSKTRADYGSGVARPKIKDNDNFELKGQFLKELRTNTFSVSGQEDANEHIEKVLKIVDLFHIPNITIDQVMLIAFSMSLTGAASLLVLLFVLDFEPLTLSLMSMPSCDPESLTNILILCLILKASDQSLRNDTPMVEKSKLDEDKDGESCDPITLSWDLSVPKRNRTSGLWYPKDSSIALTAFADADHAVVKYTLAICTSGI
ncbi:hypothetical protein Tco_0489921 [Tanacetum coccineum]